MVTLERSEYELKAETSVIAAGMVIQGDFKTGGDLRILGSVTGNIEITGDLQVEGCVIGNTTSTTFSAGTGNITGDISASDSVDVDTDAVVLGNISGTDITIKGAVKGDIDAKGSLSIGGSAKIKGNIRSASMYMETGAVIDGACVQCYAPVPSEKYFKDLESGKASFVESLENTSDYSEGEYEEEFESDDDGLKLAYEQEEEAM